MNDVYGHPYSGSSDCKRFHISDVFYFRRLGGTPVVRPSDLYLLKLLSTLLGTFPLELIPKDLESTSEIFRSKHSFYNEQTLRS